MYIYACVSIRRVSESSESVYACDEAKEETVQFYYSFSFVKGIVKTQKEKKKQRKGRGKYIGTIIEHA